MFGRGACGAFVLICSSAENAGNGSKNMTEIRTCSGVIDIGILKNVQRFVFTDFAAIESFPTLYEEFRDTLQAARNPQQFRRRRGNARDYL